jgi:hypothetical protein
MRSERRRTAYQPLPDFAISIIGGQEPASPQMIRRDIDPPPLHECSDEVRQPFHREEPDEHSRGTPTGAHRDERSEGQDNGEHVPHRPGDGKCGGQCGVNEAGDEEDQAQRPEGLEQQQRRQCLGQRAVPQARVDKPACDQPEGQQTERGLDRKREGGLHGNLLLHVRCILRAVPRARHKSPYTRFTDDAIMDARARRAVARTRRRARPRPSAVPTW